MRHRSDRSLVVGREYFVARLEQALMRRIELTRPATADVAVLSRNLELWPVLREVVDGWRVIEVETIQPPVRLFDVAGIIRTMQQGASLGYASIAARIRASGAKVLVAVDQTAEVIEELGRLIPEMYQIVIAHGSQRPENLLKHLRIESRSKRILCVWGQSDVDTYRRTLGSSLDCYPVGSLRNAGYLRRYTSPSSRSETQSILLVSQYAGAREDEPSHSKRSAMLMTLKNYVRRYCLTSSSPLVVALRPPASAPQAPGQLAEERRHYERMFEGVSLRFTDPSKLYSTYIASDEADVTIGVPSGALTESFARGNKVLMFRQTPSSGTYYGFPVEGDWLLTEPSYEEFSKRLDLLRTANREQCASQWSASREYVVANAESDAPIMLVRDLVARALHGAI
jgi:hypothetical protein